MKTLETLAILVTLTFVRVLRQLSKAPAPNDNLVWLASSIHAIVNGTLPLRIMFAMLILTVINVLTVAMDKPVTIVTDRPACVREVSVSLRLAYRSGKV